MNLSVIILVVFLSTLSTLSTRHVKRRHRNDRRLGSVHYETKINLNPLEKQRLERYTKKLEACYKSMQDQDDILIFNKNLLKQIKMFYLLIIKDKLRREQDRILHMFDQGTENEYYKGFRPNSEDDKVARNGFRPNDDYEDYGEHNSEELKNEDYKGTIQIIPPDSEESKNESNKGVGEGYRTNGEESRTENYKVTSNGSQSTSGEVKNEDLKVGSEGKNKSNKIQTHDEATQTEDFKGTNNCYWLNNEFVRVDQNFKSSHGVLNHYEDPEIENSHEAIKSVESQTEYRKHTLKRHKRRKLMNPYYYTTRNKKIKKKVKGHIMMD